MMENKFKVKIVGIVFDPKIREILVEKKGKSEKYSFIEGTLTYKEELDKCLKRVIKENTGYTAHNLGAVYAENKLRKKNKIKIHFLCEIAKGKERKGKGVVDLKWIKPKDVEKELKVKLPTRLREYITSLG